MEELRQCRVQQRNIATTIDKLTHCLPGNTQTLSVNAPALFIIVLED